MVEKYLIDILYIIFLLVEVGGKIPLLIGYNPIGFGTITIIKGNFELYRTADRD